MKRYFTVLAVTWFSALALAFAQRPRGPNIVIILADDLGWGDVGFHGSAIKTPHIDELAKEGVILDRFYTAPVCSPTRAGLMTGRYPNRFGLRETVIPPWSDFGVDTAEVFLPQLLARAGYQNRIALGKWHLGHSAREYLPLQRGFTHFYGHYNGAIDYFTLKREHERDWHNDEETSHDQGYSTDLITDEAVRCVRAQASQDSPFFLYVAYNAPHSPLQAKKEDLLQYGYDETKPPFGKQGGGNEDSDQLVGRGNTKQQTYAAMVTNMDRGIGRILSTLRESGLEENTLVLFFSDNGAAPGEGSSSGELRGAKFQEWDGGVRSPAVIKWPAGFKGGRSINQVTGYIDVVPTLLDIAGLRKPDSKPLDGISILPILENKAENISRDFYLGYGSLISDNRWKIVSAQSGNPRMKLDDDALFDMLADPSEQNNRKTAHAAVYERLKEKVLQFDAIKPAVRVAPYGEGRQGFKAPKDWKITKSIRSEGLEKSPKYNVIYILTDDLGYSELGSYGNTFNETPNLDRMAVEGVRLTNCYAAAPVCSPYRAALMTGQYPARLKITDYLRPDASEHLDTAHTTLAEMFRANGYRTGIVGKWHLSGYVNAGAEEETLPDKHGFDEVMVSENRGIANGWYFHPYLFNKAIEKRLPGHEYLTDRQHLEAAEFIERNKDRPFFLYLSHYAVHTTVHGKPELVDHFRKKNGAGSSEPSKENPENDAYKRWPADSKAARNNPHLAAQLYVIDQGVGMLMDQLKRLGIDKHTIVIFTSDNGGETTVTTNAPLRGGKSTLYEGGIREPFLIWNPTLFKPAVVHAPAANYDFYPTLMELIGAMPNNQQFDGVSVARLLQHPDEKLPERTFYWHYPLAEPHFLGGRSSGSIRKGDWKLIEFFDDQTIELYNLRDDLGENHNLASKYPEKVSELVTDLKAWRNEVNAN